MTSSVQPSTKKPASLAAAGLYAATVVMLCGAFGIWNYRVQGAFEQSAEDAANGRRNAQRATAYLYKSFWADNNLTYSAVSETVAFMGKNPVEAKARIARAPGRLMVKFLSGPMSGMESGYSERWLWRQVNSGPVLPYAEIPQNSSQIAARRFGLMLSNYQAILRGPETVNKRQTAVVELVPWAPVEGAVGPGRRLYVDLETGLTLRVEAYNYEGKPVMHSTLTDLEMRSPASPAGFEDPKAILAAARTSEWQAEESLPSDEESEKLARRVGLFPPRVKWVPSGFELDGYGLHRCGDNPAGNPSVLTRYTDGINNLTVFAMPVEEGAPAKKLSACDFGPGTLVTRQTEHGRLVALSDLPEKVLDRVLASAEVQPFPGSLKP